MLRRRPSCHARERLCPKAAPGRALGTVPELADLRQGARALRHVRRTTMNVDSCASIPLESSRRRGTGAEVSVVAGADGSGRSFQRVGEGLIDLHRHPLIVAAGEVVRFRVDTARWVPSIGAPRSGGLPSALSDSVTGLSDERVDGAMSGEALTRLARHWGISWVIRGRGR